MNKRFEEEHLYDDDIEDEEESTGLTTDHYLGIGGVMIAAAAAFFPWYVFFNQEDFGVQPMSYADSRDLPEAPGRNIISVSPLAIIDNDDQFALPSEFDPIVTATVQGTESAQNSGTDGDDGEPAAEKQPFPTVPQFRLLHVANGRALIEDGNGMYIVRIGSILPDNSRLATLEQRDNKWVIVTSNGEVIER